MWSARRGWVGCSIRIREGWHDELKEPNGAVVDRSEAQWCRHPGPVTTADPFLESVAIVTIYPINTVQNRIPASSDRSSRHETVVCADETIDVWHYSGHHHYTWM